MYSFPGIKGQTLDKYCMIMHMHTHTYLYMLDSFWVPLSPPTPAKPPLLYNDSNIVYKMCRDSMKLSPIIEGNFPCQIL